MKFSMNKLVLADVTAITLLILTGRVIEQQRWYLATALMIAAMAFWRLQNHCLIGLARRNYIKVEEPSDV